jgi:hypothetical protein
MATLRKRRRNIVVAVASLLGIAVVPAAAVAQEPEGSYPPVPTPAGAMMTVSPATVAPGSSVTVSGNKCLSEGPTLGGPQVVIGNPPAGPFVDSDPWPSVDAQGDWSTTLTIPAGWAPGSYLVRGVCFNAPGSDTGFSYPDAMLTVATGGGPAEAVSAAPSLTG